MNWETHTSKLDASVNFVSGKGSEGSLEARFVQRDPSYFIAYLSSQTGCNQACRFCHLTQLRETRMVQASIQDYHDQFHMVIDHFNNLGRQVDRMNINLMARGEPLLNPNLSGDFSAFISPVREAAERMGIDYRVNISSIFPAESREIDLVKSFSGHPVTFYWSAYSLSNRFRRKWIPKADAPDVTLQRLLEWQAETGQNVVIHHALIKGENDARKDHIELRDFLVRSGLKYKVNLVRYNSFNNRTGVEASGESYNEALRFLGNASPLHGSKIVPRVGRDVSASCGMFIS